MKKVYFLKVHGGHQVGDIVSVSKAVALELISSGIARSCSNRDFLVKPNFAGAKSKAINTNILS